MIEWNPSQYMRFGSERTRAAIDLCSRIELTHPRSIADLGCGPGNSTGILATRWPDSQLFGIDSSIQMIDSARKTLHKCEWTLSDLSDWEPASEVDLVFSNAALQWLPDHDVLVNRLFGFVAPGGALAFQVPSDTFPAVRKAIYDVSTKSIWSDRLQSARNAFSTQSPEFYYDTLCNKATRLDVWETEYCHVLESAESILEWMLGTGLRPFLAGLATEPDREGFLSELREQTAKIYSTRPDGKVLFPFRRIFVIAYR